jgi:outer membrane protein TolC
MNLSWSVLALTLIGAQDPQPSQPKTPGSPITIEIDIRGPEAVGSESASCRKAATAIAVQVDAGTKAVATGQSGAVAKLVDYCVERCVALVVDEGKATIVAKLTESRDSATKPATITPDAPSSVPCANSAGATFPMKLPKGAKPGSGDPEPVEAWPMTLHDALHVALDNSELVRVIAFEGMPIGGFCGNSRWTYGKVNSGSIVIARLNADATIWRFRAEIMAEMRSVEQQYWNLAQVHVQLWAADRAVSLAQEVLKQEEAELEIGRGTVADVAEASQRLEQFNLDLVTRTSDVITTERQLRNLLGLPPADNRRIIPVTPPAEQLIEYDWDTCLKEMMENQPDVVQQKLLVRSAELQLLIARNQLLPHLDLNTLYQLASLGQNLLGQNLESQFASIDQLTLSILGPIISQPEKVAGPNANPDNAKGFTDWQFGYTFQVPVGRNAVPNSRQAQYILLRSRAYLKQIEHQTTHSLARFFLEVDANYKQFKTSSRLRHAAAQRLDAQRAYYEEGRITTDRFLDAISQYATAVATEAQYKSTYNIALAALAEAKGTLLAERTIVIADGPRRVNPYVQKAMSPEPVPLPIPAIVAIPVKADTTAPADLTTTPRRSQWKGTRDLKAVAAAFASDLPQDVEVPRVGVLNVEPASSVNNASCCDSDPEETSTVTKAQEPTPSPKCDGACTVTKAEPGSNAVKTRSSAKAKTWTFSLSIGRGTDPLQIKGTITEPDTEQPGHAGH